MLHGQAVPAGGQWLGLNRLAAPHLLPESESPDTVNTAPKNGRVGLLGPRPGRKKISLTAFANRVVGILPYSPPGVGVGGGTGGGSSGDGGGELLVAQDDGSSVVVVTDPGPWQGSGGGAWPGPSSPLPIRYTLAFPYDLTQTGPGVTQAQTGSDISYQANARICVFHAPTISQTTSVGDHRCVGNLLGITALGMGVAEAALDATPDPQWATATYITISGATDPNNNGTFLISDFFGGYLYYQNFMASTELYAPPLPLADAWVGLNASGSVVLEARCSSVWKTLFRASLMSRDGVGQCYTEADLVTAGAAAGTIDQMRVTVTNGGADPAYAIRAAATSLKLLVVPSLVDA